ncbi:MAG: DUF1971 domain-containing protein [Gammaproteobacteria bacterium]|nr:DUF1971 domain-containing protein [Gammaproteobacteria bacterium]
MARLPSNVACYGSSPEFSERSIPNSLRTSHRTKAGTWARIVVLEGRLNYRVLEPYEIDIVLSPEVPGIVEPEVLHMVQPVGEVRFFLEFFH